MLILLLDKWDVKVNIFNIKNALINGYKNKVDVQNVIKEYLIDFNSFITFILQIFK